MLSYLIYLWSPFVLYVFIYYYFCGGYKPINKNINDITQDLGPAPPLSTTKKRAKQTHPRLYQRRINKIATLHATLSRTGGRRERENFCREKVQFRGKKKWSRRTKYMAPGAPVCRHDRRRRYGVCSRHLLVLGTGELVRAGNLSCDFRAKGLFYAAGGQIDE